MSHLLLNSLVFFHGWPRIYPLRSHVFLSRLASVQPLIWVSWRGNCVVDSPLNPYFLVYPDVNMRIEIFGL